MFVWFILASGISVIWYYYISHSISLYFSDYTINLRIHCSSGNNFIPFIYWFICYSTCLIMVSVIIFVLSILLLYYFCLVLIVLFYVSDYNWCTLLASLYIWLFYSCLIMTGQYYLSIHERGSYLLLKLFYSIYMIEINPYFLSVCDESIRYYLPVHNELLLIRNSSLQIINIIEVLDSFKFK